jgi:septum formation protein
MSFTLVLASASPRRFELLSQLGYQPVARPVDIDESVREDETPLVYVRRMAQEKLDAAFDLLRSGSEGFSDFIGGSSPIVLAGDTICIMGEDILTKPLDYDDFQRMMRRMSGAVHNVASSFALGVIQDGECRTLNLEVVETDVHFRELDDAEIRAYWETGEPFDKAGGYGIQGLGAVFVERIEGSYSNVVGLPLMEVHRALKSAGLASKL